MFDKNYYEEKKRKINERFENKKNIFLQNLLNSVDSLRMELAELQQEFQEIAKIEEASKNAENMQENEEMKIIPAQGSNSPLTPK